MAHFVWVQGWVQLKRKEWLQASCKRHQIGHLDFSHPRLLTGCSETSGGRPELNMRCQRPTKTHGLIRPKLREFGARFSTACRHRANGPLIHPRSRKASCVLSAGSPRNVVVLTKGGI